jgi:Fe-coproporphyrin III synthase
MYNMEEFVRDNGSLERFASSLAGDTASGSLRCAKIKLTPRCNLRCEMCKYWRSIKGDELSTDQVKGIIQSLKRLSAHKVHFSGGEIFLRDDLLEILECAAASGMKVNLTTNGTLISRSLARKLLSLKINSISLSIDGPDASLHDRIRGVKGAFKRIRRGIEYLRDAREEYGRRTRIRINVVLQKRNFLRIPEVIDLGGRLGATEVKIIPVDAKGTEKLHLSKKEIIQYNTDVAPRTLELRRHYGFSTDMHMIYPLGREKAQINRAKEANYSLGYYEEHLCFVPWLHTFIAWDGNVYLCCLSRSRMEPLGNVITKPLEDIFSADAYQRVRKGFLLRRFEFCSHCDDFLAENRYLAEHLALLKAPQ